MKKNSEKPKKSKKASSHSFKKPPTKHKSKAVVAAAKWGLKTGRNQEKRKYE